jgi:hypothetical protein
MDDINHEVSVLFFNLFVNNQHGLSKYFSPNGEGMLPGDMVWEFIKKRGRKNLLAKKVMSLTKEQKTINAKIVNTIL